MLGSVKTTKMTMTESLRNFKSSEGGLCIQVALLFQKVECSCQHYTVAMGIKGEILFLMVIR